VTHGRRPTVAAAAPERTARGGPRRTLTTLLVALLALFGAATPALAADDAGVPDPLAAGPYGTQKVEYDAGTLLLNLPTAGQTTSVPMKGSIIYPTGTKGQPSKVIVFVHGRHSVCIGGSAGTTPAPGPAPGQCEDSTAPDGTPISTDIRSYGGYDYMSENLASHGYAVMSIEANITGFDNGYVDRGADSRSQIINASLSLLDRWNNGRGPVTDDPDTTVGTKLVGKLELSSGVGLMGHSRGGDAVTDFVTYNRNLTTRWPLAGVVALAPTYFTNRRTPEGTNYATLLPACDGDVSPLHGARLYENSKYAPGNDAVAKVQWYVQGTNHNYFNTVWTGDDFRVAGDPACSRDAASTARLTPGDQRTVGLALMNGFLRRYVGGEKAFDPLMTGEVTLSRHERQGLRRGGQDELRRPEGRTPRHPPAEAGCRSVDRGRHRGTCRPHRDHDGRDRWPDHRRRPLGVRRLPPRHDAVLRRSHHAVGLPGLPADRHGPRCPGNGHLPGGAVGPRGVQPLVGHAVHGRLERPRVDQGGDGSWWNRREGRLRLRDAQHARRDQPRRRPQPGR
jgi:hypothetical protein